LLTEEHGGVAGSTIGLAEPPRDPEAMPVGKYEVGGLHERSEYVISRELLQTEAVLSA
jgi:hypothetical protein